MKSEMLFEWVIAYRNLFRNKWRTLATMSAIVTGFCGLCLLGGYIIRSEKYMKLNAIYINQLGHFSIYAKDGVDLFYLNPKKYQLKEETLNIIYKVFEEPEFKKDIEFSGEYLNGMGLISNGKVSHPFIAKGVDPELDAKIFSHPLVKQWVKELSLNEQGVDLKTEVAKRPESISVTESLGKLIGLKTPFSKEEVEKREVQLAGRTVYGDLNAVNAFISLRHTTGMVLAEDTSLIAPIKVLKDLYALEGITNIAVFLKQDSDSVGSVVKKLDNRLRELGVAVDVIPFYDERVGQFYKGSMDFLYIMALFFIFLICFAVAISIVNAITMGILERSREIGTMRSLGISVNAISRLFMKEALLITFFGIIVGTMITQVIAMLVTIANIRFSPPGIVGTMQFVITPQLWFCGIVGILTMIVSGSASYYVSKKKANLKIIHLLTDVR